MVQLIHDNAPAPVNADPTMYEIDTYIRETRESPASEGGVASLHPAEEYFMEQTMEFGMCDEQNHLL